MSEDKSINIFIRPLRGSLLLTAHHPLRPLKPSEWPLSLVPTCLNSKWGHFSQGFLPDLSLISFSYRQRLLISPPLSTTWSVKDTRRGRVEGRIGVVSGARHPYFQDSNYIFGTSTTGGGGGGRSRVISRFKDREMGVEGLSRNLSHGRHRRRRRCHGV